MAAIKTTFNSDWGDDIFYDTMAQLVNKTRQHEFNASQL